MKKSSKKPKISKKTIIKIVASVLVLGSGITYYVLSNREGDVKGWMSSSWAYRRGVEVSNDSGGDLTNEHVSITIDTETLITAGKLQNDCDDLRFTDSDETTSIDYWVEGGCNTSTTRVWVKIPSLPSAGKTIYCYYGNDSAANAEQSWTGSFVTLKDSSCPTGWSRDTNFDTKFPYISSSPTSTGGANSHTHGNYSGNTGGCGTNSIYYTTGGSSYFTSHTHTYSLTTNSSDVMPPYLEMYFCSSSDLTSYTSMITLFNDTLPSGWTRFSALDDKYPRGASSYGGTGGSTTHNHTYDAGTTGTTGPNKSGSGTYYQAASSTHSHGWSSGNLSTENNEPPYTTVIWGESDDSTFLTNIILMATAAPPLGWTQITAADDTFPKGSASYGSTGGSTSHTHSATINTSSTGGTSSVGNGSGSLVGGSHSHSFSVTTNSQSNLPAYYSVSLYQRKDSESISLQSEESYNQNPNEPGTLYCEGEALPYGVTDTTPEFSAVFSDSDALDTGEYYEIEVNTSASFDGTSMWDTGKTSITSITNGTRCSDISYAGTSLSQNGSTYYWRIRFWDNSDGVSVWSRPHRFQMNDSTFVAEDVIIGGNFETIYEDSMLANGLAYWDGDSWETHDVGFNDKILDIAEDSEGNIYAVGSFTKAGGNDANRIAMWDGDSWEALGSGLSSWVYTVAIDSSDNVYVGGSFTTAGGNSANRIAKWDGSSWSTLGTGFNSTVRDISIDSSTGDLYVGGSFTTAGGSTANRIAKWNGSSWSTLGTGLNNTIYTVEFDTSSSIYIGGWFTDGGGNTDADKIAMWDGDSWEPLGTGVYGTSSSYINDIKLDSSGNVYAAGYFYQIGGISIYRFAKWNGSTWSAVGSSSQFSSSTELNKIYIDGSDNIYVVGEFTRDASGLGNNIAYWNGSSWNNLAHGVFGMPETVYKASSGDIYIGGTFTSAVTTSTSANYITRWNNSTWETFGTGMNGRVYDIEYDSSGNLYAAGSFTTAGGVSANRIAKWDGNSWEALGSGLGGTVLGMTIDSSDNIYVVGSFATAGGSTVNRLAKWDGSTWSGFGTGLSSSTYAVALDSLGNIYAGGYFTDAGGNSAADYIAYWDGDSWEALGTGLSSGVLSIDIDSSNNIYAGGYFTNAGGNADADYIAYWNGSSWNALGTGANSTVNTVLLDSSQNPYIGGYFTTAGGVSANAVAHWGGSSWSAIGDIQDVNPKSLSLSPSSYLYMGGIDDIAYFETIKNIAFYKGSSWYTLNHQGPLEDVEVVLAMPANTAPSAPTSLYAEGTTNPQKVTDLTPEFSAIFNDSDSGNTGSYYQILVNTASDFTGTEMWDSGKIAMSNQPTNGNRCDDITYDGTALSTDGSKYYWKIKFWDNRGHESTWSATANFVMDGSPTATLPLVDNLTNPTFITSASPAFTAIYTDPNGDDSSAYEIEVNSTNTFDGTVMWDTGKTSATFTSGDRTSDIIYTGTALTNTGTTYYWRIKFWDTDDKASEWSSTAQFTDSFPSFKFEGLKLEGIKIN